MRPPPFFIFIKMFMLLGSAIGEGIHCVKKRFYLSMIVSLHIHLHKRQHRVSLQNHWVEQTL